VGCLLDVCIIGVIEAEQTENGETEVNNRLLAVAVHSYSHEDIKPIKQVNPSLPDQVEPFFVSYNKLRGKRFEVTRQGGPERGLKLIKEGNESLQPETQVGRAGDRGSRTLT
jgi:inorganic pyrophosphatase